MGSAWALRGIATKAATAAIRQTIAPLGIGTGRTLSGRRLSARVFRHRARALTPGVFKHFAISFTSPLRKRRGLVHS